MSTRFLALSLAVASALVSACGGSSSGSGSATVASLDIEGAAATGAAMPNASINVKCATGTGSTTTNASGAYSLSIAGGSLPCAVRATSADTTTVLHSALEGTGSGKAVINVTPMSELILAQNQGTKASDMFDQFDANKAKITSTDMDKAKVKVRAALASIVDLTGVDPIKDKLVPAAGSTAGNELDKKLDALRDKLQAAELKIADLSNLLTANAGGSLGEIVKVTLTPPSSQCKGFRTGTYRVIEPAATTQVIDITFNAATLEAITPNGTEQMTAAGCLLTGASGVKVAMGPQSAGAMRTSSATMGAVFPKQDLALADLAGTWNYVQRFKRSPSTTYQVAWGEVIFGADGKASSGTNCDSTGCKSMPANELPSFVEQADGGFTGQDGMRLYGFRAASGAFAAVGLPAVGGDQGEFLVARRGSAVTLPAVGDTFSRYDLGVYANNTVDAAFSSDTFTITAVDTVAKTYTRRRSSDCRQDTLAIGQPYAQMFQRGTSTSSTCSNASPTAINVVSVVGLTPAGLGFAPYVSAANNMLGVSVVKD